MLHTGLFVFLIEDSERHWYVARDIDDAWSLFREGPLNDGEFIEREDVEITQLADNEKVTVRDDDGHRITWRAREWAALEGRGFLASTVF